MRDISIEKVGNGYILETNYGEKKVFQTYEGMLERLQMYLVPLEERKPVFSIEKYKAMEMENGKITLALEGLMNVISENYSELAEEFKKLIAICKEK